MITNNWKFKDKPNVMVITTKNIVNKISEVLSVWHDVDDGMWQFLDGTDVDEDEAMIVSLEHIINLDNTINEISDLPLGWVAWREQKGSEWNRQRENG